MSAQPQKEDKAPVSGFERALWLARWSMIIVTLIVTLIIVVHYSIGNRVSEQDIRELVKTFGPIAPIAFILVLAIAGSLVVPTTALVVAGAALFGDLLGFVYSTIGAFFAAIIGFQVARTLGRSAVTKWIGNHPGRLAKLDARLSRSG
ncbi:MAG: TVP38/TMEM64 family protein, partial [Myxococcales bacterium]|nr:TVP38/TMEM64 family protein [Myxococcales bacterium]